MEIYRRHYQQDNSHNGIPGCGMTPRNKVSGTDKTSKNGDPHYHSHLPDVVGESLTADS